MDCSPPGSSTHGILQARVLEWLPNPGIEPGSPALQADALPSEPPGKPQHDTLICLEADADCRLTSQQELLVEQPTQGLFKCPGIPHTMVWFRECEYSGNEVEICWILWPSLGNILSPHSIFSGGHRAPLRFKEKGNRFYLLIKEDFPGGSAGKASACNAGDLGSIPGLGRSPWRREMATHSSILAWRIP